MYLAVNTLGHRMGILSCNTFSSSQGARAMVPLFSPAADLTHKQNGPGQAADLLCAYFLTYRWK